MKTNEQKRDLGLSDLTWHFISSKTLFFNYFQLVYNAHPHPTRTLVRNVILLVRVWKTAQILFGVVVDITACITNLSWGCKNGCKCEVKHFCIWWSTLQMIYLFWCENECNAYSNIILDTIVEHTVLWFQLHSVNCFSG